VLADRHGTVLALGERECSVQRRHQKVIEEAPSPVVDGALRAAVGEAAVRLASATGYVNAGTVEFLLDEDRRFYFLEMNTRLQVEHPVTELVTGLDLVAAQIRIAAGEHLPAAWQTLAPRGHAIEARLYAEDPARGFVPAAGQVRRFELPHLPGVRIDAGVTTGDTVGVHYDPLLAKVIAYGENRAAALMRLRVALLQCRVLGLVTNLSYLQAILAHPAFAAGDLSTRFLEEHGAELLTPTLAPDDLLWTAAALAYIQEGDGGPSCNAWRSLGPWRHHASGTALNLQHGSETRRLALVPEDDDRWLVRAGERTYRVQAHRRDGGIDLLADGRYLTFDVACAANGVYLTAGGASYHFDLAEPPRASATLRGHGAPGSAGLEAPMPGVLVKVHVREGQAVTTHQPLVVLEAMKMEHVIAAPTAGVVRKLPFAPGALVPAGATLVELDTD
jgi:3-methylcrotonyl-CoA carboxylase alpha subunit